LKFELYNYNKEVLIKALCHVSNLITDENNVSKRVVLMGLSYLEFIKESRRCDKDPVAHYNYIIVPHIEI
jgi:hypothetical protein